MTESKLLGLYGRRGTCARWYILSALSMEHSHTEVRIRRFAVGLLALAALAAAGYLLTRRRPSTLAAVPGGKTTRRPVEDLYAAGL